MQPSSRNYQTNHKWAVADELASPGVYQAIAAVTGLQRGRTTSHEMEPVRPVDDAVVDATLPYLNPHLTGLVEFQRRTGCRPGEACSIRRCDIDTGGPIWLYKPPHHKNAHRGKSRTIAIGPQAQKVLREFWPYRLRASLLTAGKATRTERGNRPASLMNGTTATGGVGLVAQVPARVASMP